MLDERIVSLANKGTDFLERDSQSLPTNFVRGDFKDRRDLGLGDDARSPTSEGGVNWWSSYKFCA